MVKPIHHTGPGTVPDLHSSITYNMAMVGTYYMSLGTAPDLRKDLLLYLINNGWAF